MNKEKIMSKEAFDELIDNLEIIERMTLYGRKSIKHWVKALQKENEEKDKQIELLETENADLKKLLIESLQEKKHLEKIIKELNSKRNGGTNE